jgi:hypothetical protein
MIFIVIFIIASISGFCMIAFEIEIDGKAYVIAGVEDWSIL